LTGGSACGMVELGINKPRGRRMRPFPDQIYSPSVPVSEALVIPKGS
jgi:hypothetical protein